MVTSEMFLEPIYAFVIAQSEVWYFFTNDLFSTQNLELKIIRRKSSEETRKIISYITIIIIEWHIINMSFGLPGSQYRPS